MAAWTALCSYSSTNTTSTGECAPEPPPAPPAAAEEPLEHQLEEAMSEALQGGAVSEASTQLEHRIILTLRKASRLKEALALAEASEARVRDAYGAAHSHTLHSQWLQATVLHRLGATAPSGDGIRDALALHRRVLASRLKLLGPSHPSIIESRYELGLCMQACG